MKDKIIIALDVRTVKEEEKLLDILSPHINIFKVGMGLFYSCGPKAIDIVKKYNRDVFLDLKFHDIPNTVKNSSKVATRFGVFMFNVHTMGGSDMMKAAVEGSEEEAGKLGIDRPRILGVTVLTSMNTEALNQIGVEKTTERQVLDLASLAKASGLDGVIASSREASIIKRELGKDFLIVTPGIRAGGFEGEDQKRIASPREALQSGADYLVIGRPIIKAKCPLKALEEMK